MLFLGLPAGVCFNPPAPFLKGEPTGAHAYRAHTIQTQVLCRFAPRRFAPPPFKGGGRGDSTTRFAPCINRDSTTRFALPLFKGGAYRALAYRAQTIQTQVLCRFAPRRFALPPLQRGAGGIQRPASRHILTRIQRPASRHVLTRIPNPRFAPCINKNSKAPPHALDCRGKSSSQTASPRG